MNLGAWILLAVFCCQPSAVSIAAQTPHADGDESPKAPASIDINRATADDFATLPGIGPELARRIVSFREKHGPFLRVEDLLVIKGVGRKKWTAIRPYIYVRKSKQPTA